MRIMTVARARVIWVIAPYADWPQWLKAVVMVPDCILIGIAMVAEDTRLAQTRIRASVYLVVMFFVFHMR
jgi:hypothetical protein